MPSATSVHMQSWWTVPFQADNFSPQGLPPSFSLSENFPGCYVTLLRWEAEKPRNVGIISLVEAHSQRRKVPTFFIGAVLRCLLHNPWEAPRETEPPTPTPTLYSTAVMWSVMCLCWPSSHSTFYFPSLTCASWDLLPTLVEPTLRQSIIITTTITINSGSHYLKAKLL